MKYLQCNPLFIISFFIIIFRDCIFCSYPLNNQVSFLISSRDFVFIDNDLKFNLCIEKIEYYYRFKR
ncbi:YxiF family protein [Bacillus cereus]